MTEPQTPQNTVASAPLTTRSLEQPIAYITQTLAPLAGVGGEVSTQQFLDHVHSLAAQLPDKQHCINLCSNRYLFTVALCAAVLKQQISLLPSNKNIATQSRLAERYEATYVLHNGDCETAAELTKLDISHCALNTHTNTQVPNIPLNTVAAISFTSGSTGDAKPNTKTWQTFVESSQINARYMLPSASAHETHYMLATVPAQHMWGLETSVLLALFANVCVVDAKPLFPQDIYEALNKLPAPRVLVSTPVHLRALNASDLNFEPLSTILCATSPLTQSLAGQIEARFACQLREVYGCSEIGSMAVRNTAQTAIWQRFNGIEFTRQADDSVLASAAHVVNTAILGDFIETLDEQQFKLCGRTDDLIDIAGKRGSLNEINQVLLKFEALSDGVVFFPPQTRAVPRLVALVVLPKNSSKAALAQHFRDYLDPAFVPRPIIEVEQLPREDNGKLPKQRLLAFYEELNSNNTVD